MNVLALKVGRKKKQAQALKAEQEARDTDRLGRALKALHIGNIAAPPAVQIGALRLYIDNLQVIRADMQASYGDLMNPNDWSWINAEIRQALKQIMKLRIEQVKPK